MSTSGSKHTYARALPFRSPDEIASESDRLKEWSARLDAQTAQLRRWTLRVAAGTAVAVALAVASVLFMISRQVTAPAPAPPDKDAVAKQADTKSAPDSAKPNAGTVTPADAKPAATVTNPAPTKPAATKETPAANATQRDALLELVGPLSAAHLYQSVLNIGLLADGVESKAIPPILAKRELSRIVDFLKAVDEKLVKLEKTSLQADDREALKTIKTLIELVRIDAAALAAYWDSSTAALAAQYQKAHAAADSSVKKVLGFDGK